MNEEADAVLYSVPLLCYFAKHEGIDRVTLVGPVWRRDIGFVFPLDEPLRRTVSTIL